MPSRSLMNAPTWKRPGIRGPGGRLLAAEDTLAPLLQLFEQAARPGELDREDAEAGRNHDRRRARKDDHRDADQEHGDADDADDELPNVADRRPRQARRRGFLFLTLLAILAVRRLRAT